MESDHARVKARLRAMRGLIRPRSAITVSAGHALVQNIRRGHYELAVESIQQDRGADAFEELMIAEYFAGLQGPPDRTGSAQSQTSMACGASAPLRPLTRGDRPQGCADAALNRLSMGQ